MYIEQVEVSKIEKIENMIVNAIMTRDHTTQEIREAVEELLYSFEAQQDEELK